MWLQGTTARVLRAAARKRHGVRAFRVPVAERFEGCPGRDRVHDVGVPIQIRSEVLVPMEMTSRGSRLWPIRMRYWWSARMLSEILFRRYSSNPRGRNYPDFVRFFHDMKRFDAVREPVLRILGQGVILASRTRFHIFAATHAYSSFCHTRKYITGSCGAGFGNVVVFVPFI